MNHDEPNPNERKRSTQSRLWKLTEHLVHLFKQDSFSSGDLAQLRRGLSPSSTAGVGAPAFWKVAVDKLEPSGFFDPLNEPAEQRWITLLAILAELKDLHSPKTRLGLALSRGDQPLSEMRLLRLLRARDRRLLDELRACTNYLKSHGTRLDLSDLSWLIFSQDTRFSDSFRRQIARDYYSRRSTESREKGEEA